MWLDNVTNGSTIAGLTRIVQFTETRHKILANNVANIDTPGYKMRDLSVSDFQRDLRAAMAKDPLATNPDPSPPKPPDIEGRVDFGQYLLFHDGNNRSIEKQMTAMTENAMMHNVAVELLRAKYGGLDKAIGLEP